MKLAILFEDNHLLAVAKPPGVLSQADETGDDCLVEMVRRHRIAAEGKPGDAFVGLLHRLDRPVGGLLLVAKTGKAADRLSRQFRERKVDKAYLAVGLRGGLEPGAAGTWAGWLAKGTGNRVRVVPAGHPNGQPAETRWRCLRVAGRLAELELAPVTGRPHQLRVHSAAHGHALVGDFKYGDAPAWRPGAVALHAWRLAFEHPVRRERIELACPPPADWPAAGWPGAAAGAGRTEKER